MSKRVLFVDDEPSIRGIYEMLQPFFGDDYSVTTAADGEEALVRMDEQLFDVVVSDLTMPKMTGVELLSEVALRYPGTARIVVSGFADEITAARCLMVGHRYFTKPFDPKALTDVVVSLCEARNFAANDRIREYVGKIDAIPTLSRTYLQLTKALRSHAMPIRDISAIIENDLALTAKVLQMVNSVRFAPGRRIRTVFEAVQMIGFEVVRSLVLSVQVFEFCQKTTRTDLFQSVWNHSLRTALIAKRLAESEEVPVEECDEAFLTGLLHDIGKVVLAASCPEYYSLWTKHAQDSSSLVRVESEVFGATHAHVGAYLLRLWGLPETITGSVEAHHLLDTSEATRFTPLLAVHLAQELAPDRKKPELNEAFLQRLGAQGKLPGWRSIVEQEELAQSIRF